MKMMVVVLALLSSFGCLHAKDNEIGESKRIFDSLRAIPKHARSAESDKYLLDLKAMLKSEDESEVYYAAKSLALLGCSAEDALSELSGVRGRFPRETNEEFLVQLSPIGSAESEAQAAIRAIGNSCKDGG